MGQNLKIWVLGIVGVIVVIGIILFLKPSSKSTGTNKDTVMSKTSDPTMKSGEGGDGTTISNSSGTGTGITPEFLLEQYMEWAQYPPHSRPMSNLNVDLAEPFFVFESPLEMIDDPKDPNAVPNGYRCHFQPKTWAVIGPNSEMFVTLECRDTKSNQTVPLKVNETRVFREWEGQRFSTLRADFNDDGKDGDEVAKDNIITFKWRPTKNDWGQMTLEADIVYGKEGKKATVTSTFFSSPNKVAEFTGNFRETMVDGSLIVYATIQVYKAGNYHLEANLKEAAEGNFLAYATFDGQLKTGTQEVEFLFYGKILRDKGYDGPYIITDVRGHRVNLPIDPAWFDQGEEGLKKIQAAKTTEPDKELVIPFKDEFKTKPYSIAQFTKKAWESEDKTNRIKELKEMIGNK
ncbi:MAG: hypothetical protein QXO70_05045 [Candidatus Pacearchaeota archaeon]